MNTRRIIVALLLGFAALPSMAADARVGSVVLTVPAVFKGPAKAEADAGVEVLGYSASEGVTQPAAVLQLTRYVLPTVPDNLSDSELEQGTSQYLLQMMTGIERRRTEYTQTAPVKIRLGGKVAAKATWQGNSNGAAMNGTMYCVLSGKDVIWLHAFGPGNEASVNVALAIRAIEALRIEPAK